MTENFHTKIRIHLFDRVPKLNYYLEVSLTDITINIEFETHGKIICAIISQIPVIFQGPVSDAFCIVLLACFTVLKETKENTLQLWGYDLIGKAMTI